MSYYSSPSRMVVAKVELPGSTLLPQDFKSIEIQRIAAQEKFFGYGVCQKLIFKLWDDGFASEDAFSTLKPYIGLNVQTGAVVDIAIAGKDFVGETWVNLYSAFPTFVLDKIEKNENTNEITIEANDKLYPASSATTSQLELDFTSCSIADFVRAAAYKLGISEIIGLDAAFDTVGANFNGDETLRAGLNMAAEATQTVYYIDANDKLVFKRLSNSSSIDLNITTSDYFEFSADKKEYNLHKITSSTELGENLSAETEEEGIEQVCHENAFWDNREDTDTLLEEAINRVGDTKIRAYNLAWRGNASTEPFDKISINNNLVSYIVNDTIYYNGGLRQKTSFTYTESAAVESLNISQAIHKASARVDKVNKEISLLIEEVDANTNNISQLQLNTSGIKAEVANLRSSVEASMTADAVNVAISKAIEDIDSIAPKEGFKFDSTGLHISNSENDLTSTVNEDGLRVRRSNTEVLSANNEGVKAENLHATTYLIIGKNSRLEDWLAEGEAKTACFWIGG